MRPLPSILRLLFVSMLLLPLAVFAGRFCEGLSPEQRTSTGISKLSDNQVAAIDALVQREMTLAIQGNTKGFAKSFTQRRTEGELKATGIPTLSESEKGSLDALVAERLGVHTPSTPAEASKPLSIALPKNRSLLEVHGSVSMFVGGSSHGGSFYGGSVETNLSDRADRFMLSVGYSEIRGKGPCMLYAPGYDYSDWRFSRNPGRSLLSNQLLDEDSTSRPGTLKTLTP